MRKTDNKLNLYNMIRYHEKYFEIFIPEYLIL